MFDITLPKEHTVLLEEHHEKTKLITYRKGLVILYLAFNTVLKKN
jgi:hypothetical protein